jgi:hypothetical protein
MDDPGYLSLPVFEEEHDGPFLVTDGGATLSIRDPSQRQIQERCLLIRASWNKTTERARRLGPDADERVETAVVSSPEWFDD